MAISIFVYLILYYIHPAVSDTSLIVRIGFLIFIVILSRESVRQSLELMEKGKKAEGYRKLAVKDMLTGLFNRNAYIADMEKLKPSPEIMIATFDLNDLKKCSDTFGHSEGDYYILSAANIIHDVFSQYGSCYRIGGDEFCVIIKNALHIPIEQLKQNLTEKETAFNRSNPAVCMHICFGYAFFDPKMDADLEKTRDRADERMYEDKRNSKKKNP